MDTPPGQDKQSLRPKDYEYVAIVCGSRYWNDRKVFHEAMVRYLENFDSPVLFVSGAASSGADSLIIRWCRYYRYPCLQMPADWDNLGKGAGYVRNAKMANIATHCIAFYNGESNGTKNMLELSEELGKVITIITIDKDEKNDSNKTVSIAGCGTGSEVGNAS